MEDLSTQQPAAWSGRSADGQVSYALTPGETGVLLERTLLRATGQLVHAVMLHDEADFARWCEADDVRFTQPLLFNELRRLCAWYLGGVNASTQ